MEDEDTEELEDKVEVSEAGDAGEVFHSVRDLRTGVIVSQPRQPREPARS